MSARAQVQAAINTLIAVRLIELSTGVTEDYLAGKHQLEAAAPSPDPGLSPWDHTLWKQQRQLVGKRPSSRADGLNDYLALRPASEATTQPLPIINPASTGAGLPTPKAPRIP